MNGKYVRGITIPALMLIGILVAGCGLTEPTEFRPEYVVEAYLFAGEPLPEIRLSRTVPFGTVYRFEDQAVSNAQVTLHLLDGNGGIEQSYRYFEGQRGVYLPHPPVDTVLPLRGYALEIVTAGDNRVLRAATVVPDTFRIVRINRDTVIYQSPEQLELTITRSEYPGRQTIFIFSTESLNPTPELLTPFYADFFVDNEGDVEELRIRESPPVNEKNYNTNPDGTLTIKFPWLAIPFYGSNRIIINAIDDNILQFVNSRQIQNNPSTLSPGEIPAVFDSIEGGTGIFGGIARVEVEVYVEQP